MKSKWSMLTAMVFLLTIIFSPLTYVAAQDASVCQPDKALCARMIRFGQEAYARGKYLDAKEYFRKAVKADPTSLKAPKMGLYNRKIGFAHDRKPYNRPSLIRCSEPTL